MTHSLYAEIAHEIGIRNGDLSFPDLAEALCREPSGRVTLIRLIKERFSYIYAHSSHYDQATRFHKQLATLFPVDTIVTTNWDSYFEDECGATPFVEDKDLALWNAARRKVLKIHGTIYNFGSIVATKSDYKKCARRLRNGVLGAHLKSLLATRPTVFIGYSLKDDDFLHIFQNVKKHLQDFHRQCYFVSPEVTPRDRERLAELGLHVIEADGSFFIEKIKELAAEKICFCSDNLYDEVGSFLDLVIDEHLWLHDKFSLKRHPQIAYCSWYQDGMIDALSRILRLRRSGIYSSLHRLQGSASSYERYAKLFRRDKKYGDAAYCYGYSNAYLFAAVGSQTNFEAIPPLFFHFGFEAHSRNAYKKMLNKLPSHHKSAHKFVQRLAAKYGDSDNIVLHHKDQLDLSKYVATEVAYKVF